MKPPLELAMMEVSRTNILTFKSALNVLWLSLKSEEQYETQLSGNEKKKKSLISAQICKIISRIGRGMFRFMRKVINSSFIEDGVFWTNF